MLGRCRFLHPLGGFAILCADSAFGQSTLPVELPTRFELVVNRETANALGVTIPPVVMVRADRVIQ